MRGTYRHPLISSTWAWRLVLGVYHLLNPSSWFLSGLQVVHWMVQAFPGYTLQFQTCATWFAIHQLGLTLCHIELRLTRMPTIWQYVAGVSRLFPIVKKKRLRRAKTSDKMVSTRLGSGGAWDREEEEGPPLIPDEEGCSSRIELSLVTNHQLAPEGPAMLAYPASRLHCRSTWHLGIW